MVDAGISNSATAAISAYCMSSIVMTLGNKFVLSGTHFNLNCIVLAVQSLSCLAVIAILNAFGFVSFRKVTAIDARRWFPVAVLLVLMIYTASKAIQYLSVPVFTIFKNLTIIVIAYGEVIWFNGKVTPLILGSFALIVLSSVVAAWSDISAASALTGPAAQKVVDSMLAAGKQPDASLLAAAKLPVEEFNIAGYLWMFSNCFSQAAFVLFMRKRIAVLQFKDIETTLYNNLLSIPVLAVVSLVTEDWSAANVSRNFPPENRTYVIVMMIITGFLSIGISYCSGWCIRVTSSTTYSMVGALNKLPIAVLGLMFFDTSVTFKKVFAIFLGFAAGLVYSYAKVEQKKAESGKDALPTVQPKA